MQLAKIDHIPDGHPVTTAHYNALVDVINALAEVVEMQRIGPSKFIDEQDDERIAHKRDNRQAKPR